MALDIGQRVLAYFVGIDSDGNRVYVTSCDPATDLTRIMGAMVGVDSEDRRVYAAANEALEAGVRSIATLVGFDEDGNRVYVTAPCGEVECILFQDVWAGPSLAPEWTEVAGSWSIPTAGTLAVSSSNARLIHDDTIALDTYSLYVPITLDTIDDQAGIIFGYDDSSNYWLARATAKADLIELNLIQYIGGTPTTRIVGPLTQLSEANLYGNNDEFTLAVCVLTGNEVRVTVYEGDSVDAVDWGNSVSYYLPGSSTVSQGQFGLATGTVTGDPVFGTLTQERAHPDCFFCPPSCYIEADTFSAGAAPDANYEVVLGTFSVSGGFLTTSTATSVLATYDASESVNMVVRTKVTHSAYQVVSRVIVNYVDSNNFAFVEFFEDSPRTQLTARLYRRAGGTDSLLAVATASKTALQTTWYIQVCYQQTGALQVAVDLTPTYGDGVLLRSSTTSTVHSGGKRAGLGTRFSSTGTPTWDEFFFLRHLRDDDDCFACRPACSVCPTAYPPRTQYIVDFGALALTVPGGGCSYCTQITGEFVVTNFSGAGCTWSYTECPVCGPLGKTSCGTYLTRFTISMSIVTRPSSKLRFEVTVLLSEEHPDCNGVVDPACVYQRSTVYHSADIDAADGVCQDMPVTLSITGTNSLANGDYCGGTMPSTITLRAGGAGMASINVNRASSNFGPSPVKRAGGCCGG